MAKKAQKIGIITAKEFSDRLGVDPSAVTKAVKAGRIKVKKIGRSVMIDFESQSKAFVKSTKRPPVRINKSPLKKKKVEKNSDDNSMFNAKLSLEKAKAEKANLDLQSALGNLIPADQVKKEWLNIAQNVKKNLLAIPKRIEALLAAETKPHKCGRLLEKELKRTLLELGN